MEMFLAISLGLFAFTVHELGHYEAMRSCGVRVKEVSLIGVPVPFLPSFRWKKGDTVWGVHTLPIAAYVIPEDDNGLKAWSLWDRLHICTAGPLANFAYALVLLSVYNLLVGIENPTRHVESTLYVVLPLAAALVIWMTRRYFFFIVPILCVTAVGIIIYQFTAFSPTQVVEMGGGGPIAMVQELAKASPQAQSKASPQTLSIAGSIASAVYKAAVLSIGMGVINLAPFVPLDGGQIVREIIDTLLGETWAKWFSIASFPFLVAVILYAIFLDGIRVWSWF